MDRPPVGEPDIAAVAALMGEPSRARVLLALADGRALPASALAAEAGVAASTASEHLSHLVGAGLLGVEAHGRHRYYRLAGAPVGQALEALARLAPSRSAISTRERSRAEGLRRGRLCYDHLAGRLGIAVLQGLLDRGAVVRLDGGRTTARRAGDRLAAPVPRSPYTLGPHLGEVAAALGLDLADLGRHRRPLVRCCVDWSEQAHHLAGALGAAVTERLLGQGWVRRGAGPRSVVVTGPGADALLHHLGVRWDPGPSPGGGPG